MNEQPREVVTRRSVRPLPSADTDFLEWRSGSAGRIDRALAPQKVRIVPPAIEVSAGAAGEFMERAAVQEIEINASGRRPLGAGGVDPAMGGSGCYSQFIYPSPHR
jgi:hypothetical protein